MDVQPYDTGLVGTGVHVENLVPVVVSPVADRARLYESPVSAPVIPEDMAPSVLTGTHDRRPSDVHRVLSPVDTGVGGR